MHNLDHIRIRYILTKTVVLLTFAADPELSTGNASIFLLYFYFPFARCGEKKAHQSGEGSGGQKDLEPGQGSLLIRLQYIRQVGTGTYLTYLGTIA